MGKRLHYGTTAKIFHWLIVALLFIQIPLGWLLPAVRGGPPGAPKTFHISFGIVILLLITLRLIWHLTNPVAQESSCRHGSDFLQKQFIGCFTRAFWRRRSAVGYLLPIAAGVYHCSTFF